MISQKEIRITIYTVIALAIILSAYFILFSGSTEEDDIAPSLTVLTKDFSIKAGETAIINVNFSDNEAVTNATLHYRLITEESWTNTSILNQSYSWIIPASSTENYVYFVTVDDSAGNGPIGDPSINGSLYYTIYVLENSTDDDNPPTTQQRYVFIEESTASSCAYCPEVADHLDSLKETGTYPFYYVSMIQDNPKANDRLTNHFNLYGNPTVYVDGGYQVIRGAKDKIVYEDAIQTALARETPSIQVNITAEKNNNSNQANLLITISNDENTAYRGNLKIYLTEIISSSYSDYNGNRYHNAFLDFLMDTSVEVPANDEQIYSKTFDVSAYDDYENLRVYAVVFGQQTHQQYSNPPDDNPFDAIYADSADAANLVEGGNLPPSVGFTMPKNGKIHFLGNIIFPSLSLQKTILIGRTTVSIQASDPESQQISKVELYLDNELVKEFTEEPYTWRFTGPSIFRLRHTLKAIAYDEQGKSSTDEKEIFALILL